MFHMLAIHENRKAFDATLLSQYTPGTDLKASFISRCELSVEQRWFVGADGNVGDGVYDDLQAELPSCWLVGQSGTARPHISANADVDEGAGGGAIEDSFKDFMKGTYALLHAQQRHWQTIGRPSEPRTHTVVHAINETIDGSVFKRWRSDASYRPQNLADWAAAHEIKIEDLNMSRLASDPKIPTTD